MTNEWEEQAAHHLQKLPALVRGFFADPHPRHITT
jgi:hypothetical protein